MTVSEQLLKYLYDNSTDKPIILDPFLKEIYNGDDLLIIGALLELKQHDYINVSMMNKKEGVPVYESVVCASMTLSGRQYYRSLVASQRAFTYPDTKPTTTDKQTIFKTTISWLVNVIWNNIILVVISSLIGAYIIFRLGWNGQYSQTTQPTTDTTNSVSPSPTTFDTTTTQKHDTTSRK